ncbi:MAG: cold shock and DUF1294 domain-containing protein [Pseudomonas sp.]|nr:cold shock and DUF1294 domain-containing protein [Pseudomonas sp.]
MEQQGVLRSWNDDKGFGFIRADNRDYFIHISSVQGERPQQGEAVLFVAGTDEKGRLRAESMRSAGAQTAPAKQTHNSQHRQRPLTAHTLKRSLSILVTACAIPAMGAWQYFQHSAVWWPLLLYISMSLLSILQYWHDKKNAKNGQWRTPEKQLHTVELLGGWPGALLAQQLLRHKTQKKSYQAVFWLIVLAHQVYWLDQLSFDGQLLQQALSAL